MLVAGLSYFGPQKTARIDSGISKRTGERTTEIQVSNTVAANLPINPSLVAAPAVGPFRPVILGPGKSNVRRTGSVLTGALWRVQSVNEGPEILDVVVAMPVREGRSAPLRNLVQSGPFTGADPAEKSEVLQHRQAGVDILAGLVDVMREVGSDVPSVRVEGFQDQEVGRTSELHLLVTRFTCYYKFLLVSIDIV